MVVIGSVRRAARSISAGANNPPRIVEISNNSFLDVISPMQLPRTPIMMTAFPPFSPKFPNNFAYKTCPDTNTNLNFETLNMPRENQIPGIKITQPGHGHMALHGSQSIYNNEHNSHQHHTSNLNQMHGFGNNGNRQGEMESGGHRSNSNTGETRAVRKCPNFIYSIIADLERCGSQSSSHGWSHGWSTTSLKKRIFWLTVTLISFCCLIFFIQIRVTDYLNSGVATSFSYEHSSKEGLMLPQFTLCAMNSVDDTSFYEEAMIIQNEIFEKFEEVTEGGTAEQKEGLAFAMLEFLWRRISNEKDHPPSFKDTPAKVHEKFFFSKKMAEEFSFDRILHGIDANPCDRIKNVTYFDREDATVYDETLASREEKLKICYIKIFVHEGFGFFNASSDNTTLASLLPKIETASSIYMTDHYLTLLSKEIVFEFLLQNHNPIRYKSLPKYLRENFVSEEQTQILTERGELYRTEIIKNAWMAQLLNLKDKVIHGTSFIEENFEHEINTKSNSSRNTRINKPSFSHGLNPSKHIISVKFNGRLYDPSEVFMKYSTDISTNCITLKPAIRRKFKQSYQGGASGLKLTIFTGYTGVAVEPIYKSLQRKPNFIAIIDDNDISDNMYPSTHKTFNFYAGASTNFGLSKERYNKLPKPDGTCDEKTLNPSYKHYTLEACNTQCFVNLIKENCMCKPHYAVNKIDRLPDLDGGEEDSTFSILQSKDFYEDNSINTTLKECRFEDLKVDKCWRKIVNFKKNNEVYECGCPSSCNLKDYQVTYSVTSSSIRGNLDQMQAYTDYENTEEEQTDKWVKKLEEGDLKSAEDNYIGKGGKI